MKIRETLVGALAAVSGGAPALSATIEVPSDGLLTIQAGLDLAADSDTVLVAAGEFWGSGNRDLSFGGKAITLIGAPNWQTSINCFGVGSGFRFSSADDGWPVVEGIRVTGSGSSAVDFGAGSRAVLRDCRLEGNLGLVAVGGSVAECRLERCIIIDNSGTGLYVEGSECTVVDCVIQGNRAPDSSNFLFAGGIQAYLSTLNVEGTVVTGNEGVFGGGVLIELSGESSTIVASTISGNTAVFGGGVYLNDGASATLERCIVYGNCADDDGNDVYAGDSDNLSSIGFECCALDSTGVARGSQGNNLEYVGQQVWDAPGFCAAVACEASPSAGGDFGLRPDSPCTPEASPCGERIGARNGGCGPASISAPIEMERAVEVFPNPTSGACVFQLSGLLALTGDGNGDRTLSVLDATGRRVKRMTTSGGRCSWDGRDESGVPVASGVYFVSTGRQGPGTRVTLVR